jgi:diguanylate cyclase (GGDEF)-like protein/PAS domain S-box-containing protein
MLADAEARFGDLAMACDQAVLIAVASIIVFANDAAVALLGATNSSQVAGQSASYIFAFAAGGGERRSGGKAVFSDSKVKRLDGSIISVSMALLTCRYGGQDAIQIIMRDIDERQRLEGRLQFLVRHDMLTELPNRAEFRDRLVGAIARAKRNACQVAVMLISVDHFKGINSKYGVDAADRVLREVARRLTLSVREADSVARLAGDEFGLILEAIEQREQAAVVANRVVASLKLPVISGSAQISISASAGLAAYPSDGGDLDALLRMADVAMHAAKEGERGAFRLYFPELESRTQRDVVRREQTALRIASLTEREREVMAVLVEGNSSKGIAHLLGASPRTIESHRAKVMAKMEADSLPDLVRMVMDVNQGRH